MLIYPSLSLKLKATPLPTVTDDSPQLMLSAEMEHPALGVG
jgi:hypothetical protein